MPAARPLRVAIVGVGPKGLYALERLVDRAAGRPAHPIEIVLFEPEPSPGAGPAYDPRQPSYLRMNFPAERIDLWAPRSRVVPATARRPYREWAGDDDERYPPRAAVGAYLTAGFRLVCAYAPSHVAIELRPRRALAVERSADGWRVVAGDVSGADFDEVLVAIGHQRAARGALAAGWSHAAPLVPAVFPVDRWLSQERIAPGASVAVRGLALTWIDATLALFEGRGGRFVPAGADHRLRYLPSGREPSVVVPYSRTGRPMLAKPAPAIAGPAGARVIAAGQRWLAAHLDGDPERLGRCVAETAAGLLRAAGGTTGADGEDIARWLADLTDPAIGGPAADAAAELARSLDLAVGAGRVGVPWALGEAWRGLYPAIVAELGHGGIDAARWPAFARMAAEMERLAFGPPARSVARILSLFAAGRIDLRFAAAPRLESAGGTTWIARGGRRRPVDVVVDAVLGPPGARGVASPLLAGLIDAGWARLGAGRRGLEITRSAQCVGRDGAPTPGLAAIGRPTEDWVIGNDTLDRNLHPEPGLWAERVAARAERPAPAAATPIGAR